MFELLKSYSRLYVTVSLDYFDGRLKPVFISYNVPEQFPGLF